MDFAPSIAALTDSLAVERRQFQARAHERLAAMVADMGRQLAENGMDLNVVAPRPNSWNTHKTAYRLASAKRQLFEHWFKRDARVPNDYRPDAPRIVILRPDAPAELSRKADEATKAYFDGWIAKLALKIGQPVASARVNGSLWDFSTLEVTLADGAVQQWRTRCILNVSVLGKVFNQWPTRRLK